MPVTSKMRLMMSCCLWNRYWGTWGGTSGTNLSGGTTFRDAGWPRAAAKRLMFFSPREGSTRQPMFTVREMMSSDC